MKILIGIALCFAILELVFDFIYNVIKEKNKNK